MLGGPGWPCGAVTVRWVACDRFTGYVMTPDRQLLPELPAHKLKPSTFTQVFYVLILLSYSITFRGIEGSTGKKTPARHCYLSHLRWCHLGTTPLIPEDLYELILLRHLPERCVYLIGSDENKQDILQTFDKEVSV